MMSDAGETLSALVDGEPVEPEALARALGEPDGPATLVAFVRLRRQFEPDDAVPGAGFYHASRSILAGAVPPSARRWRVPAMGLAAVVVGLAMAAGSFTIGLRRGHAAGARSLVGIYCTDSAGQLRSLGTIRSVAGIAQECVLRGEWVPAGR